MKDLLKDKNMGSISPQEAIGGFMPGAARGVIGAGVGLVTLAALAKNIKNLLPAAKNPQMYYSLRERHERAVKAHGPHKGELISRPIQKPGYTHAAWGILVPVYVGDRTTDTLTFPFEHQTGKKYIAEAQFKWAVKTEGVDNLDPEWNPIFKAHYNAKQEGKGLESIVEGICVHGLQSVLQGMPKPELRTPDRDEHIFERTKKSCDDKLNDYGSKILEIIRLNVARSDGEVAGSHFSQSFLPAAGVLFPEQRIQDGLPFLHPVEGTA